MQCSRCANNGIVEIKMKIAGEDVMFRQCGRCEAKSWLTDRRSDVADPGARDGQGRRASGLPARPPPGTGRRRRHHGPEPGEPEQ